MYVLQKPVGRGLYMMKRGGNGGRLRAVLDYCSQVPYQRRLAGSILVGGAPGLVGQGPKVVHHVMLSSQYQLSVWGSTFGVPGSHGLFAGLCDAGARSKNWNKRCAPSDVLNSS